MHWSIWTYKDIGLQGAVYAKPESAWCQRIKPLTAKKARLGIDSWGSLDTQIRHIIEPLEQILQEEFPDYNPFPFGSRWQIGRLVRGILLAEALLGEFGGLFRGISEEEIDDLMRSFLFSQCEQRARLAEIWAEYA